MRSGRTVGGKEVGEESNTLTMGCFAVAICDRAGVRLNSLPLSYEKVWRALRQKRTTKEGQSLLDAAMACEDDPSQIEGMMS